MRISVHAPKTRRLSYWTALALCWLLLVLAGPVPVDQARANPPETPGSSDSQPSSVPRDEADPPSLSTTLAVTPSEPILHEQTRVAGTASTRVARPIQLERQVDGQWKRVAKSTISRTGLWSFKLHWPADDATPVRVTLPKKKIKKKTYREVSSAVTVVPATRQSGTLVPMFGAGSDITITAQFLPARAGRTIHLQHQSGSRWKDTATAKADGEGRASFSRNTRDGVVVSYRAVAAKYRGAASVTTPTVGDAPGTPTPPTPPPTAVDPVSVDDSNLLPAASETDISNPRSEANRLISLVNTQATGHLTATEQLFINAGVSITDGGLPANVIRSGDSNGDLPTFAPAAAVLGADVGAANDRTIPLSSITDSIATWSSGGKTTSSDSAAVEEMLLAAIDAGTSPTANFRRAMLEGDGRGQGSLETAVSQHTPYDLSLLQATVVTSVLRSMTLVEINSLASSGAGLKTRQGRQLNVRRAGQPPNAWLSTGCSVDAIPPGIWTGLASISTSIVSLYGPSVLKVVSSADAVLEGFSFLSGMVGLFSDTMALMVNTLTFSGSIEQSNTLVRTKTTQPGGIAQVTAKFRMGNGANVGALQCIARAAALFGIDADPGSLAGDLAGAQAKLEDLGDDNQGDIPATFGPEAADLRVQETTDASGKLGKVAASMTGAPQQQDKSTSDQPVSRSIQIRATVYPSTAGPGLKTKTDGIVDGVFGVSVTLLGTGVAALTGDEIGAAIAAADAAVKAIGVIRDAAGDYRVTYTLPLEDWLPGPAGSGNCTTGPSGSTTSTKRTWAGYEAIHKLGSKVVDDCAIREVYGSFIVPSVSCEPSSTAAVQIGVGLNGWDGAGAVSGSRWESPYFSSGVEIDCAGGTPTNNFFYQGTDRQLHFVDGFNPAVGDYVRIWEVPGTPIHDGTADFWDFGPSPQTDQLKFGRGIVTPFTPNIVAESGECMVTNPSNASGLLAHFSPVQFVEVPNNPIVRGKPEDNFGCAIPDRASTYWPPPYAGGATPIGALSNIQGMNVVGLNMVGKTGVVLATREGLSGGGDFTVTWTAAGPG